MLSATADNVGSRPQPAPHVSDAEIGGGLNEFFTSEDQRVIQRIDDLNKTNARVKFLSCEPLIGPLPDLPLNNIDWVIVGGESGRRPRPMKPEWVLDIQDQCLKYDVAFFFKQWGGTNKKKTGRLLDGRTWDEMPELPEEFEVV